MTGARLGKTKEQKVLQPIWCPQANCKWKAPGVGCFKINVDASVRENETYFSVGMALLDHHNSFLRGKTVKIGGNVSVFEVESVGVLEALMWAKELEDKDITLETESMLTVNAMRKSETHLLELIFQHCREILTKRSNVELCFVK